MAVSTAGSNGRLSIARMEPASRPDTCLTENDQKTMLAKEVKRIIRSVFEPACRDHGFRRTKRGGLGWYHPVDDHYFVITFRTPRQWNRHWGGFLECRLRIQDQINPWIPERRNPMEHSIVSLASEADREAIRDRYDKAAARTTIPNATPDHLTIMERELSEMLRVPLDGPLSAESDNEFLLRFHTAEDVRQWAAFILERLPEWMEDMAEQWQRWHKTTAWDMKSHQPFLKAIQADPESDSPRLTYADWLAERGDAWSEVIRIQCQYPDGYMPFETANRLEELLNEHQCRFDRGADDLQVYVRFRRGMIEEVYCSVERFLKAGSRILETFPLVNILSLHTTQGRGMRLAEQPALSVIRSLKLMQLADDDCQWIFRSQHLGYVEKLRVALPRSIDLAWLLDTPLARQLRVLDLTGSRLDADVLALFGETDAVSGLETLVLSDSGMDDEMAKRLSDVATFRNLKRLSIDDNPRLGIAGIAFILKAEFASHLELLAVGSGWPDDYRAQDLAESQLSSTVLLSMKHSFSKLDEEAFKRRFPNCSFGQDLIARHL
jgi:uncharacterized protein (TIGR02996 family)